MSLQHLLDHENHWPTRMGKAFLCERVVMRGKDLHHDLGDWDWFRMFCFSITGREFTEPQLRLLNWIWLATSYPDPSIWPNHVAALAGTVRSTCSLSMVAGLAVSEASIYGRRPDRKAQNFFYRAAAAEDTGLTIEAFVDEEIRRNKTIYGYGRPLARIDERIPHTLKRVAELGLDQGRHLKIALRVYHYLKSTKGLSMNIAAINAALSADLGLGSEEHQMFLTLCFVAGMPPCYIDARDRPEGAFFPLRCEGIVYEGVPRRAW